MSQVLIMEKKKELKRHKIGLKKHEPFIEEDKWM
jgi:hypothetical protein